VITKEQLKAWRDAAEKATAGPWEVDGDGRDICGFTGRLGAANGQPPYEITENNGFMRNDMADDARFIAISREAVPALVAEVERLRAVLRDFVANYDCDADAHRYNTNCRACVADAALGDS
jgi:hypothetical protein